MTLKAQLHDTMLAMYSRAGTETGYWGRRFLQSVRKNGGLATAKRMLQPNTQPSQIKGLLALAKARRADLSLEYLVLREPFRQLFTEIELAEASKRLRNLPKNSMPTEIPPEQNFPETKSLSIQEGGVRRIVVNAYERDPRARTACLRKWGTSCKVCNLSFEKEYGFRGKGFIHVHHLDPLGKRKKRKKVAPTKDLIPVCPNCHAMLHSSDPPLSIDELIDEMKQAATNT